MLTKNGDFIEIEFIARTKEDNKIFDLTNEKVAKENNLYDKDKDYSPVIICLGHNDVLPGLDKQLINKDLGKYIFEIKAEEAFGKKDANLIKLIPTEVFTKQNMKPVPGLHVDLDGVFGLIRSVSGGRTIIDFNHPLSSHDLSYEVEIKRFITNVEEKVSAVLRLVKKDVKFKLNNEILSIDLKIDDKKNEYLKEEIKKRIPEIKEIRFEKTTTLE